MGRSPEKQRESYSPQVPTRVAASVLRLGGDPDRASSPPFITRGGGSTPPQVPPHLPLPPRAASGQSLCFSFSVFYFFLKNHQLCDLSLPVI